MSARRTFLRTLSGLPLAGGLVNAQPQRRAGAARNYLRELGVEPIINAAGHYTMFTGSLMHPEAVRALACLSAVYVRLDELHEAVGARIGSLLGCEAAIVTSGAAAALAFGTAACITGTDSEKIRRFPDLAGMKNEVIIQKAHRFPYDHSVRACGVRLVEVETAEELEAAIHPRTALLLFLNKAERLGRIRRSEFVALGKRHEVPTFNDAAADVPPAGNLTEYTRMGFDLVTFSGGKGLRGPQSAGLLLGRKDLIRAARMNTSPNSDTFGRGFKVNKEEMVAMLVALEQYLKRDHDADWRDWQRNIGIIASALKGLAGVSTEPFIPEIANEVPHLRIRWDGEATGLTAAEVMRRLREGTPSIEPVPEPYAPGTVEIASWTLTPREARIVAARLREIFLAPRRLERAGALDRNSA